MPVLKISSAAPNQIALLLFECDEGFHPRLSSRVDIPEYAKKVAAYAECFELWEEDILIGIVAMYCNSSDGSGFITNVCVHPAQQGNGFASFLVDSCIDHARREQLHEIELEVGVQSVAARRLYSRHGFTVKNGFQIGDMLRMRLDLKVETE